MNEPLVTPSVTGALAFALIPVLVVGIIYGMYWRDFKPRTRQTIAAVCVAYPIAVFLIAIIQYHFMWVDYRRLVGR